MKRIYLIVCIGILTSCNIFDKEEDIPSFILISAADLQTNAEQGANTNNIVDVTVFADNTFVGTFELPATVPIMQSGDVEIAVGAGIKNNGLSSDRRIYPFYDLNRRSITLIPDARIPISADTSITFQYYSEGLNFEIEDFELQGSTLSPSTRNSAFINDIDVLHVLLTPDSNLFEVSSSWGLNNLPKGSSIYLEIDFKGTIPLEIGILTLDPFPKKVFALGLLPQEEFTKVYVDLTDEIAREVSTTNFEIYLESELPAGSSGAELYIDNLKFIYP
ncbi:hypothetical protein G3O08_01600 [Cryomorpha ignava]|uniref:Uncharacterized protein n=1 Tax=Cryomorpha ignava TaxID=101383 RepID=A0A7K3WKM3_9FLAO|nr:hypothetical protein [Cryomorpha ignava]NEN22197.1 hypothetical protein [Cryomorpha ignava]